MLFRSAAGAHGLDLDAAPGRLFCACDAGTLVTLDATSGRVLDQRPLSGVPDVVWFNRQRQQLYVAVGDPGVIDCFDTTTMKNLGPVMTEEGAHTTTLAPAGDRLYAVHGDSEEVSAFTVDRSTGHIAFINRQSTQGKNPVHLALDPTERFMVVSNHISSSLAVLSIEADGSLGALTQLLKLEGEPGPHRKEQPFAKPHFNPFDPSGRFVVVPDKGLDKTFVYEFKEGQLKPASYPEALGREASGPRHIAFHPTQPWAYVANELDSTVSACQFTPRSGELRPFQIVSGLRSEEHTSELQSH